MAKQPIPKKEIKVGDKLASLKAFKEKNGLGKVVEKEPSWIILPEAFQKVTKIPGIPCG
jgi:hypothetical protein